MPSDEQYYNISQACWVLRCYRQEFHRLCEILGIIPQSFANVRTISESFAQGKQAHWNRKEKYITGEELAQLKELRGVVPDAQDQQAVMVEVQHLRQKIAELQAEVQELKARKSPTPHPTPAQLHFSTEAPSMVDGLLQTRFCARLVAAHGVNEATASYWRAAWPESARTSKAEALRWARGRMGAMTRGRWHECADPQCPCHTL